MKCKISLKYLLYRQFLNVVWLVNKYHLGQKAHLFDVVYRPPDNTQSLIVWNSTQRGFLDQPSRSTASFAELSLSVYIWCPHISHRLLCRNTYCLLVNKNLTRNLSAGLLLASTRDMSKEFIHPDRFCQTSTEFYSMTSLRVRDRRTCALIISKERRLSVH